jgi:hypothetical protein
MATETLSKTHTSTVSITRPADTTTYAAGEVVCNAATLEFPGANSKGSTCLNYAVITSSQNSATKLDGELWLFSATVAAVADNAAFAPTDAEMLTLVTVVPFATADWKVGLSGSAGAGNATCQITGLAVPISCRSLFGQLVTRNAYPPIASEVFQITLGFID